MKTFSQFILKANEILESRGQDLRDKYKITKPGQASAKLADRIDDLSHEDERYEYDDNMQRLGDNARKRSQEEPTKSPGIKNGKSRMIRSRGGRPQGKFRSNDGDSRDQGDAGKRFADFAQGKTTSPYLDGIRRYHEHGGRPKDLNRTMKPGR
jgi:hypothetical protein